MSTAAKSSRSAETGELKGGLRPQTQRSRALPRPELNILKPPVLQLKPERAADKKDAVYPWTSSVQHQFVTFEEFQRWLKEKSEAESARWRADRPRVFAWVWTVDEDPEDEGESPPATAADGDESEEVAADDVTGCSTAAGGIAVSVRKLPPVHTAHIALNVGGGLATCSVAATSRRDINRWLADKALPRQDDS